MRPGRALALALQRWAARYSGYDAHLRAGHPPIGALEWGELVFIISSVTFCDGHMNITATASASQAGRANGQVILAGTDDQPVLHGTRENDMGIKMAGSTWKFTWSVRMPVALDDTPPPPEGPPGAAVPPAQRR